MNKKDIDAKIMEIKNKISQRKTSNKIIEDKKQTKTSNKIIEDKTPTKIISYENIYKKNCNEDINIIINKYI
jgi:hypothetical protein